MIPEVPPTMNLCVKEGRLHVNEGAGIAIRM